MIADPAHKALRKRIYDALVSDCRTDELSLRNIISAVIRCVFRDRIARDRLDLAIREIEEALAARLRNCIDRGAAADIAGGVIETVREAITDAWGERVSD